MDMANHDPYQRATYSFTNRLARLAWGAVYALFYRPSPRPLHGWRCFLLKLFGARLAPGVHPYPSAKIWAPWNLVCDESASIGEDAVIYNPQPLYMGSHAIISQYAFICGATHDYEDPAFPTIAFPMRLGAYCWICARASVQPGVNVGAGAILALGSIATRDLEPWTVYGGVPAKPLKKRVMRRHSPDVVEISVGEKTSLKEISTPREALREEVKHILQVPRN